MYILCYSPGFEKKLLLLKRKVLFEFHLPYEIKLDLSPQHFVQIINTIKSSQANRTVGV
jgi:hypothetical protein